jgi:hypothetical protein
MSEGEAKPEKKSRGMMIGLIVGGLLLLTCCCSSGVGGFAILLLRSPQGARGRHPRRLARGARHLGIPQGRQAQTTGL